MAKNIASLTLLLPGFELASLGAARMPALQTLLSKGSQGRAAAGPMAQLFNDFSFPEGDQDDQPAAALCALGHGLDAGQGWWLVVDPVYLEAGRDHVYLSAYRELNISQAEADALVSELNHVYAEDGWRFFAALPQRWLLRLPEPVAMTTTPTEQVGDEGVGDYLPQGNDAMLWQRVMNEVQMILHGSSVNEQRETRGDLAINGLWFWGGGRLPQAKAACGWDLVVADDCLALGLARLHGVKIERPEWDKLSSLVAAGNKLLWLESSECSATMEPQLFSPLLERLREGDLATLVVEMPGVGRWNIERKDLRRWWRRTKTLEQLLKD